MKWLFYTMNTHTRTEMHAVDNITERQANEAVYTLLIYVMFMRLCLTFHSVNRNMGLTMPTEWDIRIYISARIR